jgi:hypothetical protein
MRSKIARQGKVWHSRLCARQERPCDVHNGYLQYGER